MATEQVLNWIGGSITTPNREAIKLSSNIDSFEKDFANGYLFGEILSQFGFLDMSTLSKKTNKESKVNNFYQVEQVLRKLKVNFDAKLIHQVMYEERGASLRLLYQIKLSVDKHFSNSKQSVTGLHQSVIDKKVKHVADLATKLPEIKGQHGIEGSTIAPGINFKYIEDKLLKFELAHAELKERARKGDEQEKNMLSSIQQDKRKEAIRKLQENQQFMKDWEATGKQSWKQNQEKRAYEIKRALEFEDREIKIYKNKLGKELNLNNDDMVRGIDNFHENMQKLGIEQNISIAEATKRQEEKKGIPPGQIQNFSYAATMNKIKETKNNNEFAGKERERRNRKMQVDQRAIQEQLDVKKHEDQLIKRLLEKQAQEQSIAMTIKRQEQCRLIVTENRKKKAHKAELDKHQKNLEIDKQMKKMADDAQAERTKNHDEGKKTYKQTRWQEKLKKRALNIEIASELIDLIMDVAEETNDKMEANFFEKTKRQQQGEYMDSSDEEESELIPKPIWRHWMSLFGDGKKVSEENIVIEDDDESDVKGQGLDSMSQLLQSSVSAGITPYKLINEVKNEQIYCDLLQYICQTGPLNLRLVAPEKWHTFKNVCQQAKQPSSFQHAVSVMSTPKASQNNEFISSHDSYDYLNLIYPPQNIDFGKFMDNLYSQQATVSSPLNDENKKQDNQSALYPIYHNLKLCILGPKQSGKKTVCQAMKQRLGENIQIFDMNELLREALQYVDPNANKEENADPKAKKPKGQEAPVDPFAGKDTTSYKEIASSILKQINITTGQQEIPGKDVDLINLVSDDEALVQLFGERLRLAFPGQGPTSEEVEQTRRDKIQKEAELKEQLLEAKNSESIEVDPKAKKGKVATKSVPEIEQELKQLLEVEKSGWAIIDFPRTLNQAKVFEKAFTGFQPITDKSKSQKTESYEVWSKFTDPEKTFDEQFTGEIIAQPSLFDQIILLDISQDEIQRRTSNRKVDPSTNTVYSEDNPAPENDTKLMEKLQPYYGQFQSEEQMNQKLRENYQQYSKYQKQLSEFYSQFGQFDKEDNKGLEACNSIKVESGNTKEKLSDTIKQVTSKAVDYKQLGENREYEAVKRKALEEEEKAAELPEEGELQNVTESAKDKSAANLSSSVKPSATEVKDENIVNDAQGQHHAQKSVSLKSKFSAMGSSNIDGRSRKKNRVEYTPSYMTKIWEDMELAYFKDGLMAISDLKKQRVSISDNLNLCQKQYIEYLERGCRKQEKVNEFIFSFNQFSAEFPQLRKDDQTKDELLTRLERLSNELWDITNERKDESLAKIAQMAKSGWSNQEMRQLVRNIASLIEIEIKKFEAVFQLVMQQESPVELDAEIFAKKCLERGVQPYDGTKGSSPAMEQVLINLMSKTNEIIYKQPQVVAVLNDEQGIILRKEKDLFFYKLAMVYSWALVYLEEIYIHSRMVYERLDDWIVFAVQQENQSSQEVIDFMKDAIQNEQLMIEDFQAQMQPIELFSKLELMHFRSDEVPLYLREIKVPSKEIESNRFSLDQLNFLYKNMRYQSGDTGHNHLLEQSTFTNLLVLTQRQGRMPLSFKYNDFTKLARLGNKFEVQPSQSPRVNNQQISLLSQGSQQNSGQNWLDWKKIIMSFALLHSKIPTDKVVEELKTYLKELAKGDFINEKKFTNVSDSFIIFQAKFWFDSAEGQPDSALQAKWISEVKAASLLDEDYDEEIGDEEAAIIVADKNDVERLNGVKKIIFDTFRVHTGEDQLNIDSFTEVLLQLSSLNQTEESCTFGEWLIDQK